MATSIAEITGNSDDPFWRSALQQFETIHRPRMKDGFTLRSEKSQKEKIQIFDDFMTNESSVQDARNICLDIRNSANDQYTNQSLNLILGNLDFVIKAGDMAFKGGAETIAMAWSGVKFILQVVQADRVNCQQWAAAGAAISTILVACRTFGKMYRMNKEAKLTDAANEVINKLTPIYIQILNFSWAAKKQLSYNKAHRMFDQFNPFSSQGDASTGALDAIKASAKDVRDASQVAFQEWSKQSTEYSITLQHNTRDDIKAFESMFYEHQQNQNSILESIKEDLSDIKATGQKQMTMLGKQEVMLTTLTQAITLKSPYEVNKSWFAAHKKALQPQTDYLQASYNAKVKVHDQNPATCKWIFDEKLFKDWRDSPISESAEKGLLWLTAGPGYGKSILVSFAIEVLKRDYEVAFFYCSRIDSSDGPRSTVRIKQDLAFQLLQFTEPEPHLLEEANKIFAKPANAKKKQEKSDNSRTAAAGQASQLPDLDEAIPALAAVMKKRIFVIIDALDECIDREFEGCTDTLKSWARNNNSDIRVLISSRPEHDLNKALGNLPRIKIEEHSSSDIQAYVGTELKKITGLSSKERSMVSQAVVERAQGQFTYVNLALNILRKPFVRPIESLIKKLAADNREMNQETLKRTDAAYIELARSCLRWTLLRQGDITVRELMEFYTGLYSSREVEIEDNEDPETEDSNSMSNNASEDTEITVPETDGNDKGPKTSNVDQETDGKITESSIANGVQTKSNESEDQDRPDKGGITARQDYIRDVDGETEKIKEEEQEADNVNLYIEQIRKAAGAFLEIKAPDDTLVENHPSVRESFKLANGAKLQRRATIGFCETCQQSHGHDMDFIVEPKFGHLELAIQCLRSLNNPQYQRKYLIIPQPGGLEDPAVGEGISAQAEDSVKVGTSSGTEMNPDGEVEMVDEGSMQKPSASDAVDSESGKIEAADGTQGTGIEELDNREAPANTGATEKDLAKDISEDIRGNESQDEDKGEAHDSTIANDDPNEELQSDEDDRSEKSDDLEYPDGDLPNTSSEEKSRKPYAVFGWIGHMRELEKAWGWNTRDIDPFNLAACEKEWESDDNDEKAKWLELRDELMHFYFGEGGGFRPWYLKAHENRTYISDMGYYSPLTTAALYGLASLAVMLVEKGESIADRDPVTAAAPLFMLSEHFWDDSMIDSSLTDNLNDHRNMISFLSGKTSNQEAAAEALRKFAGDDAKEGLTLGQALFSSTAKEWFSGGYTIFQIFLLDGNPNMETVKLLLDIVGTSDHWDPADKREILHAVASASTYPEIVSILVEQGKMNANNKGLMFGNTPLHILLGRSDLPEDMLDAFLAIPGIDVNEENKESERPLIGACVRGHLSAARKLLDNGADIHDPDIKGYTATSISCSSGHVDLLNLLVERGGRLLFTGEDGRSPLYIACWKGKRDAALRVLELLKNEPIEQVDQPSKKGRTPLRKACFAGMQEVVETILAFPRGDDRLSITDNIDGRTVLHVAAARGHHTIVKTLLDHNADVFAKDKGGRTAIQLCFDSWTLSFREDYEETIMLLLDKDPHPAPSVGGDDDLSTTMVHVAALKGSVRVLNRLMKLGLAHSTADSFGWTPLLLAKRFKHDEAVSLLESFGAESSNRPIGLCRVDNAQLKVSVDGRSAERKDNPKGKYRCSVLANHPIPPDVDDFYFEVTINKLGDVPESTYVAIGICSDARSRWKDDWAPGHYLRGVRTYGYHSDDGAIYNSETATIFNPCKEHKCLPKWNEVGKTAGCGFNQSEGLLYFTREGERFEADIDNVRGRFFPVLGLTPQTKATVNFGDKEEFVYKPANAKKKDD